MVKFFQKFHVRDKDLPNQSYAPERYELKLANNKAVQITLNDVLRNNLSLVTDTISDLKIADCLADKNPMKNFISVIESGRLNHRPFYRIYSVLFLFYIWSLQVYTFFYYPALATSVLLINFWGTYSILRFQIRPYFEINTLFNILFKKDMPVFLSSISYVIIGVLYVYLFYDKINFCSSIFWKDIGSLLFFQNVNEFSNLLILFILSLGVAVLTSFYNIFAIYERFRISLLLKQ